jgi:AraC-like DNA-binding protein
MSSTPGLRADPPMPDVLEVAAAASKPFCINFGDGPASTTLVCGYLACDARPFNPLLESLPPVIKVGDPAHDGAGWISQFIRFAVAEAAGKHAGSESVLTKLSELLFIDVVRRYLETLPPEHAGWLAGLRDPLIGKVMSMMHARSAHDWTIDELAREAGMSRSVLAERFAKLIGIPPMHYLAKWRMQIASELLTSGKASLASIAADVGYESEASFSRAFKKMIGVPPSAWRRQERPG